MVENGIGGSSFMICFGVGMMMILALVTDGYCDILFSGVRLPAVEDSDGPCERVGNDGYKYQCITN